MASLLRMSEPVCLIENSSTLRVNEEAKAILSAISQRLVVVSIVGPYRSGKSYLMNKLSEQPGGVFSVSSTTEAKTKGIWMWCSPHPHKPDHTLVLLDTEGFGDTDKGDKDNDRKILALAMFMSSAVVYNSSNVINYDEVEKLGSTLELYCEVVDNAINKVPLFVWVVRDFTLKSDLDGRPATADEYLENCLKDVPPKTIKVKRTNMVRQKIREHFPKRKCFYFAFPSSDTKTVARMSQAPESQLEPEFVRNANDFCQFVLQEAPEKELKEGRFMSGSDLAQVLQSYIDVVTKRTIHFLEHSISNIFLEENKRSICRSIESYESQMKAQLFKNGEEFDKQHEMSLEEALQEFRKSYITHEKSQEEYLHQLEEALLKKRAELWRICEDSSLKKCEEVYNKLTDEVDGALKKEKYHVPGGYDEFVKDRENIIQTYNKECDGGIKAPDVLKKLSNYLEDLGNTIPKIAAVKKPKKLQKGDSLDWNKLLEYVQDFQLPPGRFDRLLIQLFGYTGHGKSSFVNSCSYVLCNGRFKDQAGEGVSQGGKTMERKAYNLTDTITIVDNRGFAKLQGQEAWEIYAQLCNFAPLNETVVWKKNLDERHKYILQRKKKSSDLIFPVFVCSGKHNLSEYECDNIKQFLRKAQELTGIQPFVVLTNSRRTSALQATFSQMGMEKIFPVENYVVSDHIADREKHLHFLNFLKDVRQHVTFYLQGNNDFQSQEHEWMSFLLKMAADLQMGSC